jgi:hypothetical protein
MSDPTMKPRVFSLNFKPANDVSSMPKAREAMVALFSAFSDVRRAPRSPEKSAWLEAQGLDPDAAFPNQAATAKRDR